MVSSSAQLLKTAKLAKKIDILQCVSQNFWCGAFMFIHVLCGFSLISNPNAKLIKATANLRQSNVN